jgi:hypothetical protein
VNPYKFHSPSTLVGGEQNRPANPWRHDAKHVSPHLTWQIIPPQRASKKRWRKPFACGWHPPFPIDKGLAGSRFGIVVLSRAFLQKNWTQYELDGLVSREMEGTKVILPIWHNITKEEVLKYSPSLADKYALNSDRDSLDVIAKQLSNAFKDA